MNAHLFSMFVATTMTLAGCFWFGGSTTSDPCDTSSSCTACANRGGCGWCGATASCRTGSSSGPDTGSCSRGWAWLPSTCGTTTPTDSGTVPTDSGVTPTGCAALTDCGSCTGGATCGWCAADGRCYDGRSSGPNGTTCAAGWAWLSTACPTTVPDAGCTPNCAGRVCGSNGCGGSCGSCSTGESCDASGQCQPVAGDRACAHVTCPTSYTCTWNISGVVNHYDSCCADGGSADWAMCGYPQNVGGGATQCERSIGATADQVCHVAPSTMHCELPMGSIDCPGLWIETLSDGTDWYFTGCCGDNTVSDPSGNIVRGLHCGIANGPTGDCFPAAFSPTARPAM